MGGFFGVASKSDCALDLFFGVDYHSHLGTRRGGLAVLGDDGKFERSIHNIQNSPFRTLYMIISLNFHIVNIINKFFAAYNNIFLYDPCLFTIQSHKS